MKNQRKKLFIHPEFQKSFLLYTTGITLISLLAVFLANMYFFQVYETRGKNVGIPEGHIYYRLLQEQRSTLIWILVITFAVVSAGTFYYGLFMSNKIAGPIMRLKSYFKGLKNGNEPQPLKFREGDYFADVAEDINGYLGKKESDRER